MPRVLGLAAAARLLKAHPDTITEAIRTRGLPACKVGRAWLFIDDDLIAWVRSQYGQQAGQEAAPRDEPPPLPARPAMRHDAPRELPPDLAAALASARRRKPR